MSSSSPRILLTNRMCICPCWLPPNQTSTAPPLDLILADSPGLAAETSTKNPSPIFSVFDLSVRAFSKNGREASISNPSGDLNGVVVVFMSLTSLSSFCNSSASRSIIRSMKKAASGLPAPLYAPCGGLLVMTEVASTWALSIPYGPVSCIAMKNGEDEPEVPP